MPSRTLRTAVLALLVSFGFVKAASAYYNPQTGRFLNRDPIGEPGARLIIRVAAQAAFVPRDPIGEEHQLYVYVKNAPTLYIDPLGLKKCSPATGSLRCFMEKYAGKYSPFTRSGKPDPDDRINWKLLSCLACQESNYNPCAVGPTNDFGLMQLTRTGAIAQCQQMGIFKKIDDAEFGKERREKCCAYGCQPRCEKNDKGECITARKCCEGCEDSIWNIEKQIECASAYLQHLRDSRSEKVTLAMLICMYNKGAGAEDCQSDGSARKVEYVKSVLECLGGLDKVKLGDPGVITPPKELE